MFDPITARIPNGLIDTENQSINQWPIWDAIILDQDGIFWFFAFKDAIYRYDPIEKNITRHVSLEKLDEIGSITLSKDGSIYLFNLDSNLRLDPYILEEGRIYQFLPEADEIKPLEPPTKRMPVINSLLADHLGRLWLGVYGWKEPDGGWYFFHPRINEFLYLNKHQALWTHYIPPDVNMESSDGRLWFVIPRSEEWKTLRSGIAWYDPSTKKGCWFTTEGYRVGEDVSQSVWLVAKGKLYRYSLRP